MSDKQSNTLILIDLALSYAAKLQEIGALFRNAQLDGGRDVTDEEVDTSSLKRDAQIAKTQGTIDSA
jgi:hypothetical protein